MFPVIDAAIGRSVLDSVRGCTFDDFHSRTAAQRSVAPRPGGHRSVRPSVPPHHAEAADRLGKHGYRHPRADGDRQAEEGGIGIIDRGFRPGEIEPQVREVENVKRTQHGVIGDPYSVVPSRATVGEAHQPDDALARRHAGRRRRRAPAERPADRARRALRERSRGARLRSYDAGRIGSSSIADRSSRPKPSASWSSARSRSCRSWTTTGVCSG